MGRDLGNGLEPRSIGLWRGEDPLDAQVNVSNATKFKYATGFQMHW